MSGDLDLRKSPEHCKPFSDYLWQGLSSLDDGPIRSRAESFLKAVNWSALQDFAAAKRNGSKCEIIPHVGLGYNHMVRILEFDDGDRWVARLKLPSLSKPDTLEPDPGMDDRMIHEVNTILLLRRRTSIPIPEIYAFETRSDSIVGAPFMLMDCLKGNAGIDLGMTIPLERKQTFLRALAKVHVQLSRVQLPKIGTVVSINSDGICQQGPIPGLGGPFTTATEFFKAWAAQAVFGKSNEQLREASGLYADEIARSTSLFPKIINKLADRLSSCDHGPFPICHGDFGHNNVVVDDKYMVLGVIDWEGAFAAPWEIFSDFPLSISTVPPAMDVPWNYNEDGSPKREDVAQKLEDQKEYLAAVREEENSDGCYQLSEGLRDTERQQLAAAMRLFRDGKPGWYSKVAENFKI